MVLRSKAGVTGNASDESNQALLEQKSAVLTKEVEW